jgi:hypothetical protein
MGSCCNPKLNGINEIFQLTSESEFDIFYKEISNKISYFQYHLSNYQKNNDLNKNNDNNVNDDNFDSIIKQKNYRFYLGYKNYLGKIKNYLDGYKTYNSIKKSNNIKNIMKDSILEFDYENKKFNSAKSKELLNKINDVEKTLNKKELNKLENEKIEEILFIDEKQ